MAGVSHGQHLQVCQLPKIKEYEFGDNVTGKISCGKKMEEAQFSVVC